MWHYITDFITALPFRLVLLIMLWKTWAFENSEHNTSMTLSTHLKNSQNIYSSTHFGSVSYKREAALLAKRQQTYIPSYPSHPHRRPFSYSSRQDRWELRRRTLHNTREPRLQSDNHRAHAEDLWSDADCQRRHRRAAVRTCSRRCGHASGSPADLMDCPLYYSSWAFWGQTVPIVPIWCRCRQQNPRALDHCKRRFYSIYSVEFKQYLHACIR